MGQQTLNVVYPPCAQWLQEFCKLERSAPGQTARQVIGEFAAKAIYGGPTVKFNFELAGHFYEQVVPLMMNARELLKKNGIKVFLTITRTDQGKPYNSIRLESGGNLIKIREKPDNWDMLAEVSA